MLKRVSAAVLAAGLSLLASAAPAQQAPTVTVDQGRPNSSLPWFTQILLGGNGLSGSNPLPVTVTNGGTSGSITAAGTNGSAAQAVQGINGGVPLDAYAAQYNATLPTLTSGGPGYLSVDANGRLILAPTSSIVVSASALPAGAATSAKQAAPGTAGSPSTDVLTVQGATAGTPLPVQNNSSVAVTDASGTIAAAGTAAPLAANSARQILVITNTGSNPMTVRFGSAATAAAGHIVGPGANLTFDDKCPTGSVNLFSTSGTTYFVTSG